MSIRIATCPHIWLQICATPAHVISARSILALKPINTRYLEIVPHPTHNPSVHVARYIGVGGPHPQLLQKTAKLRSKRGRVCSSELVEPKQLSQ